MSASAGIRLEERTQLRVTYITIGDLLTEIQNAISTSTDLETFLIQFLRLRSLPFVLDSEYKARILIAAEIKVIVKKERLCNMEVKKLNNE